MQELGAGEQTCSYSLPAVNGVVISKPGAGAVNPPVFERVEYGFMTPALPIWKTEELDTLPILIILI
jgi:hypothetical protein